ncbi:glucosylceramidase-like isoform X1 [Centruroides sculpturatus]|uniref:glucosylceramidase-like isoform X1 n=1 Tax=Centruroides sculpturatus TaxID=218467 RepID=UPI000C6C9D5A|nr:glucosylceramidase-like isoform X1 [Centruroides sculpturatus]
MDLCTRFLYLIIIAIPFVLGEKCQSKNYGYGSVVCVCNVTFCDQLGEIVLPTRGVFRIYESNKYGMRFFKKDVNFSANFIGNESVEITIDRTKRYQEILGFGGAFTDASGINILSLPAKLQDQLLRGYYSSDGLDYTIGRVPMASCDFSTRVYSYDDVPGDFNLTHFNLTKEDLELKIPLILRAEELQSKSIKLFASPWSAPGWMKNSGKMAGPGVLKGKPGGEYYQTWADYFVRFLQAYEELNVTFWGVTAENEPMEGFIPNYSFQAMGFTAQTQRDFIRYNLGPTLKRNGYGIDKLKLMILDDQRYLLPKWAEVVLNETEISQYVAGIAFHWYANAISPPEILDITRKKFPNKFILSTEACAGSFPWDKPKVKLGSWERGESYAHDIIQDLNHWTSGWVDWNLALNPEGGPNWVKNFVDSPIIVNVTAKEFYRQPTYYALAHFSKLLPPGSVRIDSNLKGLNVDKFNIVAFERPDNGTVLVIINSNDFPVDFILHDSGRSLNYASSPRSFQSILW